MSVEGASANNSGIDKVELHTPRLLLRAAVDEDAEHMYKAFNDPEVMRYWYGTHITLDEHNSQ